MGQHRVQDGPGRLDRVLAGEERLIAGERISQQPLVRLLRVVVDLGQEELVLFSLERLPGALVRAASAMAGSGSRRSRT